MAQSDARFGYQANLNRELHDLSRPFGFTCAPGMLLPVFHDLVSAGDTLYVKHDLPFLRTQPLAAPAMVDVKIHMETFFVPMQMIYQPWENGMYSLTELQSSFYNSSHLMNNNLPVWHYETCVAHFKQSEYVSSAERADALRLADMFSLNGENFCTWNGTGTQPWRAWNPNFFPWQLLAYHTIFYYYYRLDDKSQFDSSLCNWDSNYDNSDGIVQNDLLTLHSRPWNFDYFTSMYYSPIVSNVNMQRILPNGSYQDLNTGKVGMLDGTGLSPVGNSGGTSFSPVIPSTFSSPNIQNSINTANLRQMFANEKLAMITGRTRKNYDSQVLAHLGVEVPHDVKHDLTLIGQDIFDLRVGEVTSLASTENSPLGELAGKGWSSSRDDDKKHEQHKFTAPVDGVVMTLFSVEPIKRYFGGFDRVNAITSTLDFPRPEFDRLGNVPMYAYETGGLTNGSNTDVIGWKERYYAFKRRAPKVSLAFETGLDNQGTNDFQSYMLSSRPFGNSPEFRINGTEFVRTFATSRPDLESRFYIPFNAMDNVMLVDYLYGFCDYEHFPDENWDNKPWLVFARDPFIVDCYPSVRKVSWLSKDGEPIYPF